MKKTVYEKSPKYSRRTAECFSGENFSERNSKIIMFGAPFEGTSIFKKGQALGPKEIRECSERLYSYSNAAKKEYFENAKVHDIGDLEVKGKSAERVVQAVEKKVKEIRESQKVPAMLGGEHTVTLGALKAVASEKPIVVQFDTHADLMDELCGQKINHGTFIRRALEFLPARDLVQLGIRGTSKAEWDFIQESGVKCFEARELHKSLEQAKGFLEQATSGRNIYITVDLDFFCPGIVPGTGTPQPGGLCYWDAIELLESIKGKVIGFDVVECCPDDERITGTTAAKLLYDLIALLEFE